VKTMVTTRSKVTMAQYEATWNGIADSLADAFRMQPHERQWFQNKPIARLIAAIPMMAGCHDAERTAVAHLGTYLLSLKSTKPYFNANAADDTDIFERLRLGMNFVGGDEAVIEKGMSMIALCMVIDYARDIQEDAKRGKYNPVDAGSFDYESIREDLEHRIEAVQCPEMEMILRDFDTQAGFWSLDALPWEF
jgi:hypothetical protein